MRCALLIPLVAIAVTASCRDPSRGKRRADDAAPAIDPRVAAYMNLPELQVVTLVSGLERPNGIALDEKYIYFETIFRGWFSLPRAQRAGDSPPRPRAVERPPRDPHHAYADENGITSYHDVTDGEDSFHVDSHGVWRVRRGKPPVQLARSFDAGISIKVILLDATRVTWLEPAASRVLSVPRAGGPVTIVCEAWIPIHYDMVFHGDRLYLLSVGGELYSAPARGGPTMYHANLDSALGFNRNGVWLADSPEGLYIASDSIPSMRDGEIDGRILRVQFPPPGTGVVQEPHHDGLMFATNIWMDGSTPSEPDLARLRDHLSGLAGDLRAGRFPVTISITAGERAARTVVPDHAAPLQQWLVGQFGPAIRTEIAIRPPRDRAALDEIESTIQVGIAPSLAASLFAPPPASSPAP